MRQLIALLVSACFALADAAQAEILIKIDKSSQRMTVSHNGETVYTWPVSTGRTGHATPTGLFNAFRMESDHHSKEWDDAPMPHSIFFTKIGHAIHGTYDTKKLGVPASHGCVRLSPANAATLFAMVKQDGLTNTKVALTGSEQLARAPRASEHPRGNNIYGDANSIAETRPQLLLPDYRQSYFQPGSGRPLFVNPPDGFGPLR